VNYSRGFKAGGFNDQIGGFAAFGTDLNAFREAARATKPETADSFEAGIKTELWDHRLRFNLTGFYVKYKDLQKQLNVPIVVNGNPEPGHPVRQRGERHGQGRRSRSNGAPVQGLHAARRARLSGRQVRPVYGTGRWL